MMEANKQYQAPQQIQDPWHAEISLRNLDNGLVEGNYYLVAVRRGGELKRLYIPPITHCPWCGKSLKKKDPGKTKCPFKKDDRVQSADGLDVPPATGDFEAIPGKEVVVIGDIEWNDAAGRWQFNRPDKRGLYYADNFKAVS